VQCGHPVGGASYKGWTVVVQIISLEVLVKCFGGNVKGLAVKRKV
jgi:hypothetical protein